MPDQPTKLENLSEDGQRVFDVLNEQSDIAVVVVGAAYLDNSLEALLSAHFRSGSVAKGLLGPKGALGTYSARLDTAYCLDLISKSHYEDLKKIGEIRNRFAHSHLDLNFSSEEIQRLCSKLKEWKHIGWPDIEPGSTAESHSTAARTRYAITVAIVSQRLLLKGLGEEMNKEVQGQG